MKKEDETDASPELKPRPIKSLNKPVVDIKLLN
jgi:hypothetical protein